MIGKHLIFEAAKRIAQNPEVQRRATELAFEAYQRARPTLENAGKQVAESMREALTEHDPRKEPVAFAKAFRRHLLPPKSEG